MFYHYYDPPCRCLYTLCKDANINELPLFTLIYDLSSMLLLITDSYPSFSRSLDILSHLPQLSSSLVIHHTNYSLFPFLVSSIYISSVHAYLGLLLSPLPLLICFFAVLL